jgi:integrase
MNDEIRVHVVDYGNDRNLMMRYTDPFTGKHTARSTGTRNKTKAERAAAKWEGELREGRYQKPNRKTWEEFRIYYSANALPSLAKRSQDSYESTLNVFEQKCQLERLAHVTTARVTAFATALRNDGRSEATIAHHLRHLKAAMRWANREGLLNELPKFSMPKRVKGAKVMRGRPITTEEFERMIKAVPKVVDNAAAKSWKFYLRGLWESGLRLSESLTLRWEDGPDAIIVDFSHTRPMLRIPAEVEKGYRDRMLPMTPGFAELLAKVPVDQQRGRVFKLIAPNGSLMHVSTWEVSRIVSAIGKKTGIVVDERVKGDEVVRKFASAHDLRRAFGKRWAAKLPPHQLKEVMRHASINTTLAYYVGDDALDTANAMWSTLGNTSGNTELATKSGRKSGHAN